MRQASFAERTMRSLQNFVRDYTKDLGHKCIQEVSHIVTTLISRKLLSRNDTKNYQEFLVFVHSVQQGPRKFMQLKFKFGDSVRISEFDLLSRNGFKPHFTLEFFEIVAFSSRKLATFAIKGEQAEIICDKLYQKELIEVLQQWKSLQ